MRIAESELIINGDGSVFHLHLRPEELADNVILVGDPGRVDMIAEYFEEKEFRHQSREFVSVTGKYKGVRMTALSTGIGTDNIDIVMNELDALANIDLIAVVCGGFFSFVMGLRVCDFIRFHVAVPRRGTVDAVISCHRSPFFSGLSGDGGRGERHFFKVL